MAKTKTYVNMPILAQILAYRIVTFLEEHKYEVVYSYDEKKKTWCLIHARKAGALRTVTGNRRALSVSMRIKKPRQCSITIGSGEWGKNTILSAVPMIAFPVVGFLNFVSSATSSKMSESDLWTFIESMANKDFYKYR